MILTAKILFWFSTVILVGAVIASGMGKLKNVDFLKIVFFIFLLSISAGIAWGGLFSQYIK
jgi:hypothetical protein